MSYISKIYKSGHTLHIFRKETLYLLTFILVSLVLAFGFFSYKENTYLSVAKKNEITILNFQEEIIKLRLKRLSEDITYLSGLKIVNTFVDTDFSDKKHITTILTSFMKRRKVYSSVRIIDFRGQERFRLTYNNGKIIQVAGDKLQNKKKRYYFQDMLKIHSNDVYFSLLDFNYENGRLTVPLMPVLRVGKLLGDRGNTHHFFIILNYLGENILRSMVKASGRSYGTLFLRNKNGSLISADGNLHDGDGLIQVFLRTKEGIAFIKAPEGQIKIPSGILTHQKIKLLDTKNKFELDYFSFINTKSLNPIIRSYKFTSRIIFLILLMLSVLLTYYLTRKGKLRLEQETAREEKVRIFDSNPAPVLKASQDGVLLGSNSAAKKFLKISMSDMTIPHTFVNLDENQISKLLKGQLPHFEYSVGKNIFYFTTIKDQKSGYIFIYGFDITENTKIKEEIEKFQIAVKQSANVIVFTDLQGRILFANKAFEKVTGYRFDELKGEKPSAIKSGYHTDAFYKELWTTILQGKVWQGEFYNKRKDGTFFWEKATITPVLDRDGKPKFFIAVKEDITEKKILEEELKKETENANKARIAAEKAKSEADSANQLKSIFLANMSHEIRTPMNAILGYTRLLLENDVNSATRDMLEIILGAGNNLLALINDILDFSKIEANEITLNMVKINLPLFFQEIKDLFILQAEKKGLTFIITLDTNVPETITGDENRIRQIFINLIGNALKFTSDGKIEVTIKCERDFLVCTVSDTGIGISGAKIADIFSPFKQLDSAINRKYQGTGLGLAISRKLAELMDGTITVKSEEGKGSSFILKIHQCSDQQDQIELNTQDTIDTKMLIDRWMNNGTDSPLSRKLITEALEALPRHLKRLGEMIEKRDLQRMKALTHELAGSYGNLGLTEIYEPLKQINTLLKTSSIDMDRILAAYSLLKRLIADFPANYQSESFGDLMPLRGENIDVNILVADDSEINRKLIHELLAPLYLQADYAINGFEVLSLLQKKQYDIILLDIQMPELDGIETLKQIRSNREYDSIKVIAVTAHALEGDKKRYLKQGFNDYISKPFDFSMFKSKIEYYVKESITQKNDSHPKLIIPVEKLKHVIKLIEREIVFFNPARVRKAALVLEEYSSDSTISSVIQTLQTSAETFDASLLTAVIEKLKECISREEQSI